MINLADHIGTFIGGVFMALLGAIGFLVRKVLTDGEKIKALESQLETLSTDVRETRQDVKDILFRLSEK
jgi:uncharacterized membrane protein (DUF106 family)